MGHRNRGKARRSGEREGERKKKRGPLLFPPFFSSLLSSTVTIAISYKAAAENRPAITGKRMKKGGEGGEGKRSLWPPSSGASFGFFSAFRSDFSRPGIGKRGGKNNEERKGKGGNKKRKKKSCTCGAGCCTAASSWDGAAGSFAVCCESSLTG